MLKDMQEVLEYGLQRAVCQSREITYYVLCFLNKFHI